MIRQVAYHPGGRLFAGDETEYDAGWYLFAAGEEPFTNEPFQED
jgi:hypothetical protein